VTDDDRNRDPEIDLSAALSRLRTDVRRSVAQPAATQLRLRADRRLRTRRTTTALVAAAVVGVTLVGGGIIWSGAAPQPPPVPGGSTSVTPSGTPSGAASGTPSAGPRPSRPVAARSSPQVPELWKPVDWTSATIVFPTHTGCPSGAVTFGRQPIADTGDFSIAGPVSYPKVYLATEPVAYGDVTGDGQPEAILRAACKEMAEDSGDGQGQALVVRRDGGTLRVVGWVGPRGGLYSGQWVTGGRLFVDVKPWHTDWGYRLGAARSYRWTGRAFTEENSGYPGIVPVQGGTGPAIDVGPVEALSGCPSAVLRFDADGRAVSAGVASGQDAAVAWDLLQPQMPDGLPHLVDLDGDGRRRLLLTITCGRSNQNAGTSFMAVLDRRPDGSYRAVDALRDPPGKQTTGAQYADGALTVWVTRPNSGEAEELRYTWNGEYFQR
jgi:hypothetical protein